MVYLLDREESVKMKIKNNISTNILHCYFTTSMHVLAIPDYLALISPALCSFSPLLLRVLHLIFHALPPQVHLDFPL